MHIKIKIDLTSPELTMLNRVEKTSVINIPPNTFS